MESAIENSEPRDSSISNEKNGLLNVSPSYKAKRTVSYKNKQVNLAIQGENLNNNKNNPPEGRGESCLKCYIL